MADGAVGGGLEEQFGAVGGVDEVVEVAALFGFLLAGDLRPNVRDAGGPDFMVVDGGKQVDRIEGE